MKRIPFLFWISCLLISQFMPSVSWGQGNAKPPATTAEAASLEGTVVDAVTRQAVVGATIVAKNQAGNVSAQQRIGTNGAFRLTLDPTQAYLIATTADGYEPVEERLAFTSTYTNRLYGKTIALNRRAAKSAQTQGPPVAGSKSATTLPVSNTTAVASGAGTTAAAGARLTPPKTLDAKVVYTPPLIVAPTGKTTQLRAIQFVQSKAELLPDAQPALEQLLAFMRDKPTVEILLAGHTDNQGNFDENLRLSQQRVDLVKDYLVKNGIAANRINARGYGPTRPIATNNYETGRQQNRRVEMIVVKP